MAKDKAGQNGKGKVKAPRKRVEKATFLPTMEPVTIPEIDAAATYYYEVMMDRVEKSKEEDTAKDALIDAMNKAGQTRYQTPEGLVVTIVNSSNVKCKRTAKAEATAAPA